MSFLELNLDYKVLNVEFHNLIDVPELETHLSGRFKEQYKESVTFWNGSTWAHLQYGVMLFCKESKIRDLYILIISYGINRSYFLKYNKVNNNSSHALRITYYLYLLMDNSEHKYPIIMKSPNRDTIIKEIIQSYNYMTKHEVYPYCAMGSYFINVVKSVTRNYVNLVIALCPLKLPTYVILWILDLLIPPLDIYKNVYTETDDLFQILSDLRKVRIIEKITNFKKR